MDKAEASIKPKHKRSACKLKTAHNMPTKFNGQYHSSGGAYKIALAFTLVAILQIPTASAKINDNRERLLANYSTLVRINKCCEPSEFLIGHRCTHINETDGEMTLFQPKFFDTDGHYVHIPTYQLAVGLPDCGKMQQWEVFYYGSSVDKLQLLSNGVLRHTIAREMKNDERIDEYNHPDLEVWPLEETNDHHFDYPPGRYCIEKRLDGHLVSQYAIICAPEVKRSWTDADILIRRILNPLFHLIALICYLFVSVVYFVIPTLRDLVGNIVTTISICYIVSTCADVIRMFTELSNHYSFLVADIIVYMSILAAFFWINSMGYYIWKTFKSRNIFLRITDGKKYCYYSFYVWLSTGTMALTAIFAHFMIDFDPSETQKSILHEGPETIGWLGIAVFFTPIAVLVTINIYFYTTTMKVINRMQTYGRIHHKLRHSFRMFTSLSIIMTVSWIFLLLSWLNYDAIYYTYVAVNSLQAPLFLYVCVFEQKHVSFLLRKTCCYANCCLPCCRPQETDVINTNADCWGDEMQAMNSDIY